MSKREADEVSKQLEVVESTKRKRKPYRVWTAEERAEIGKHVFERVNAMTVRLLSQKYPGLTKQSVSDFKKAYTELKEKKRPVML